MFRRIFPAAAGVLVLTMAWACGGSVTSPSSTAITIKGSGVTTYTYTTNIQPILASDCVSCHGPSQQQDGFNFSSYAGVLRALTPGSEDSLIIHVTQPGGLMYGNLSGDRNGKAGTIYDWIVNSGAAQ
jgi:hypothetical protein